MTELRYRHHIRELLESIAALDPWPGPVEMICGWFDDLYMPAHAETELNREAHAAWRACFTPGELEALARFHADFERLAHSLSADPVAFAADPGWREMSRLAKRTLKLLDEHS